MKDIDILNVASNSLFSDKIKYDLKNIMDIDVDGKDVSDVLREMKNNWSYLDPIAKEVMSQSIVGKRGSCEFQAIMDF